jgi:hypothetical protein
MRFRVDSANSASKHWIDAEREHDECKTTEYMKFIQDFLLFSKLSSRSKRINDTANTRALDLYRIWKPRIATGKYTITTTTAAAENIRSEQGEGTLSEIKQSRW